MLLSIKFFTIVWIVLNISFSGIENDRLTRPSSIFLTVILLCHEPKYLQINILLFQNNSSYNLLDTCCVSIVFTYIISFYPFSNSSKF